MALEPGTRLGPYQIVSAIGAGGMGEVYRARDTRLRREVAVKVLPEAFAADPERLRRFRDEAMTASSLNHPNIVQVYDIGEQEGVRFVAMELVEGVTFSSLIAEGPLPWERIGPLGRQVLEGLAKAHAAGIVHRDVKPANLMVSDDGYVKILDFGIAKQLVAKAGEPEAGTRAATSTVPGVTLGTFGYMSPEQAKGAPSDHRSDHFSFGSVVYEMATGQRPFARDTVVESLAALIHEQPETLERRRPDLPATAGRLVMRCLAKSPDDRFATTAELLAAFVEAIEGERPVPRRSPARSETEKAHRSPLAGRDRELGQLVAAVDRAREGRGGLVTLVGEPGVGKTRLTEELAREARTRDCLVVVGHCYEGEGAPPYSPWIEILERSGQIADRATLRELLGEGASEVARIYPELRQLLPDLKPPLDLPPEQARPYLFRCFREFVERSARRQPLVVVLEDLHWADDATLLLLEHLAPHVAGLPLVVLGTYRDVDLDVSRPFAKTLRQLVRERLVERIALHRLEVEGVATMLAGLAGRAAPAVLAKRIHDETEGNPFFVEEVYLHLEEEGRLFDPAGAWRQDLSVEQLDVPEGVRLVVGRRLERLGDEATSALTAAAVLGRRFTFELLAAIVALDADTLLDGVEEAERLALIEPAATSGGRRETGYRFAHELIRQTLLGALSMPRRQRMHLRIAEAIEQTSADPIRQASALAHHLYQAGAAADEEKTVRYLTLAGQQALESGAFEEAARHCGDALALIGAEVPRSRAALLHCRGSARRCLGLWREALDDLQQALALFEELADVDAMTKIALAVSDLWIWQAQPAQAVAIGKRVLVALPKEAEARRARLLAECGRALSMTGDFAAAEELTSAAIVLAEEQGDDRLLGEVLLGRTWHFWFFMLHAGQLDVARRSAELLGGAGDLWKRVDAAGLYTFGSVHAGRLEGVAAYEDEVARAAERLGHFGSLMHLAGARMVRAWMQSGDLGELTRHAERAVESFRSAGNPFTVFIETWAASRIPFLRGDWEEALERAAGVEDVLSDSVWKGTFWAMRFVVECYLGHEVGARSLLAAERERIPVRDVPTEIGAWYMLYLAIDGLGQLASQGSRWAREEVAELYPAAAAGLRTSAVTLLFGDRLLETLAGVAALAGRQWELAEQHFETATRQAREIPFVSELPEAQRMYAWMLIERAGAGDREKARALLDQAIRAYDEIGMPRHRALVESMRDALPAG